MKTIELSLEEVKERIKKGYIYSGTSVGGDYRFFYGNCLFMYLADAGDRVFYDDDQFFFRMIIANCLDHGELYELEDPTLKS